MKTYIMTCETTLKEEIQECATQIIFIDPYSFPHTMFMGL